MASRSYLSWEFERSRAYSRAPPSSQRLPTLAAQLPQLADHAPDQRPDLRRLGPPVLRRRHASACRTGAKVGLVGRNGVGKSTLFKLILGELHAGGGEISLPKAARIGSVDQEHPATPGQRCSTPSWPPTSSAHALLSRLETAEPEDMGDIYDAADRDRRRRARPSRAAEILAGLGFSSDDLARPMAEFSGGWRMRVALAAALFAEPDLLLLDEPTNYLDLEGALWLEARLKKYPHTALIISHDRELLNNSVDSHPAPGGRQARALHRRLRRLRAAARREGCACRTPAAAKQEAERAHLQAFVDRFRAKASKAAQAQSRMKMLAKLPPVAATIEERVAPFTLPSPRAPAGPAADPAGGRHRRL